MKAIQIFLSDEQGGQLVEWPLLAALLSIAVIAAWGILDGHLQTAFSQIGGAISTTGSQVAQQ